MSDNPWTLCAVGKANSGKPSRHDEALKLVEHLKNKRQVWVMRVFLPSWFLYSGLASSEVLGLVVWRLLQHYRLILRSGLRRRMPSASLRWVAEVADPFERHCALLLSHKPDFA